MRLEAERQYEDGQIIQIGVVFDRDGFRRTGWIRLCRRSFSATIRRQATGDSGC